MRKLGLTLAILTTIWICGWITDHTPVLLREPLAITAVLIIGGLVIRYKVGPSHPRPRASVVRFGTGSTSTDAAYVAHHEIGHAKAFLYGGFTVDKITASHRGGCTITSGTGQDKDYATAVMAGAEAGALYLQKHCGYSRAAAERKAYGDAGADMRGLKAEYSSGQRNEAQRLARKYVHKNWDGISRDAAKLERRGTIHNY